MRTAFVVVKHDGLEGRFMVGQWDEQEAARPYPEHPVYEGHVSFLEACGWAGRDRWAGALLDFALVMEVNGSPVEGSVFAIGGDPTYDLNKRQMPRHLVAMWVAFLTWLYANLYSAGRGPGSLALADLPALLDLSDAATTVDIGKGERME